MKITVKMKNDKLNYTFVYSRIIAFIALYFSIYTYSSIGELAFLPLYFCLLAYFCVFLLVLFAILAVAFTGAQPPAGQELEEIEKKSGGWWSFLYNGFDLVMFWFMSFVMTRNGFPDMAFWMNSFFWVALLMGAQALYLRLWFRGKFN